MLRFVDQFHFEERFCKSAYITCPFRCNFDIQRISDDRIARRVSNPPEKFKMAENMRARHFQDEAEPVELRVIV